MSDGAPTRLSSTRVAAWAAWDWGSAAFNAVVTTFVFTVWLTGNSFVEAGADSEAIKALHSQWLGWGIAAAGILVAVTAPALGAIVDASGRQKPMLAISSTVVGLSIIGMWFIVPTPGSLQQAVLAGIVLLAIGTIAFEVGSVAYNAILVQITTPATLGRVSSLGWGAGYVGGIVLLLVVYFGFIAPEVGWFGVTSANGINVRVAMLVSALWFVVFALPVLLLVPDPVLDTKPRVNVIGAYQQVGRHVATLWRTRRPTLQFLIASAVFRDGMTGVFTFGGVLAAGTFGFSDGDVIIFAIGANIIAGVITIASGWFDDKWGPRRLIYISLISLVVAGGTLLLLHDGGPKMFWIFGLALAAFVGPAQAASRGLMARLSDAGRETEMFGLYATTGRAATFLAPTAFALTISLGGEQYWGILGIVAVLVAGLLLFLPIRFQQGAGVDGRADAIPAGTSGSAA